MSSDVTHSTGALHPLLRQALERARAQRTSIIARMPAPRPLQDPWELAQQALRYSTHATVWSDPDQEMLAVGVDPAMRLVGEGEARLTALDAKFQSLESVSHPLLGKLPLWFGGFSFDHRTATDSVWQSWPSAELVTHAITAITYQRKNYLVLSFVVSPDDDESALVRAYQNLQKKLFLLRQAPIVHAPPTLTFEEFDPASAWHAQVARAQAAIQAGTLGKIVLARRVSSHWPTRTPTRETLAAYITPALHALRRRYHHCTTFAFLRADNTEPTIFFGATPELLVARKNSTVHTMALAGTAPRAEGYQADESQRQELLASSKERQEHAFVVRDIQQNLENIGIDVHVPSAPDVVTYPNVHHLRTPIRGKEPTVRGLLSLADALHPTPAICGTPTDTTYAWLHAHEGMDRGWYAGGAMWLNDLGDGRVNVALRSAIASQKGVCAYAGAGIVEGSDATQEWDETRAKLSPICQAFAPISSGER